MCERALIHVSKWIFSVRGSGGMAGRASERDSKRANGRTCVIAGKNARIVFEKRAHLL